MKGSFDKYIEENKSKKGTSEVDKEFLSLIEDWRNNLAKNIALRNTDLSIYELNYAVQKIIDRIIFLRIAEDRQMEEYSNLKNSVLKENIYTSLNDIFKKADDKYNSGIFKKEQFFDNLKIDNKVLKSILNGLYYPDCPYEFSIFTTEILGNIYEQFLGKTIRLTASHQAKVEEKPEVKKVGGVYYTPQYIVDYIVQNTVGEKIANKTPTQIKKIKICDPACGSGSFLIGAYRFLLNYHLQFYIKDNNRLKALKNNCIYQVSENNWALTINEKQEILLNNIFGVDIDSQAVEVTKLSLLLKLMEGENEESAGSFFKFSDLQLLPDLSENIKCGNSLIGTDYYSFQEQSFFDNEEKSLKINAFDWRKEFIDIISSGGFDIIIGNPPYVKEYTDKAPFEFKNSSLKKYYQGKMDLWYACACHSIDLLKPKGYHSFIATNNWITNAGASILRNHILDNTTIAEYIDFGDFMVFKTASIQTMVYILQKKQISQSEFIFSKIIGKKISEIDVRNYLNEKIENDKIISYEVTLNHKDYINTTITFNDKSIENVLEKIFNRKTYNLTEKEVAQGIVAPQDFVNDKHLQILKNGAIKKNSGIFILNDDEKKNLKLNQLELNLIKPYYTTNELGKYFADSNNIYWIIYTNKVNRENIKQYPKIKSHLDRFKEIITSDFKPYGLHRARVENFFLGEKIISLRKAKEPTFTYVNFSCYFSQTFYSIKPVNINLKYLLGLFNSELSFFWFNFKGKKQGDLLQIDKAPLLDFPICIPDINMQKDIINDVNLILNLQKKISDFKEPNSIRNLKKQISSIQNRINIKIYEIYHLDNKDITIIWNNLCK